MNKERMMLPEDHVRVLIQTKSGSMDISQKHYEYFGGDGVIRQVEDVIAWMRLPEPFQEDSV